MSHLPSRSPPLNTEATGTAPPDAFGPFRVLHQIGAGTLGPVYRAYDAQRERLVAIKRFTLDLPPERVHQLVAAFEALIAAQLTHPVLAAPIATGISGVEAFLVQDYVGAESLDLAVREYGTAPVGDALRVAAELAGALDFAAAASIVHGALHPRDILLSTDETRLTGIGVARALAHIGATVPVRRPYTAPERISGATWDRRADVFSLAAAMHELLWGRRIAGLGAHVGDSLTEIAGGDPAALRATFTRALAEDPGARFPTALEFAEALQNAFPGISVAPAVVSTRTRSARKPDRAQRESPRVAATRGVEPGLPLEPAGEHDLPMSSIFEPVAETAADQGRGDVDLRRAQQTRYADVETAPAIVDVSRSEAVDPLSSEPAAGGPAGFITGDLATPSALDRTRSAVWPLVLALGVGVAIGFAGGYFTGTQRDRPTAAAPAMAAAPAPAGRDFTESTVPAPSKAASAPVPAAPEPPSRSAAAKPPAPQLDPRPSNPAARSVNSETSGPGRLLIRSTPAGATVSVDGREYGRTPVAVRDLSAGAHQVTVTRTGYAPSERRIVLTRTRPAQSIVFDLIQQTRVAAAVSAPLSQPARSADFAGTLSIDSRPSGAQVFLDGKLMGSTPLSLTTVTAGEHAVRLERDGYRRWSSQVRIVASEQNRVTASLER